jgi:hypothetical protein
VEQSPLDLLALAPVKATCRKKILTSFDLLRQKAYNVGQIFQ